MKKTGFTAFFAKTPVTHKKNESRFNPVSELLWRFSNSVVKPRSVGTKIGVFSYKQKIYRIFSNTKIIILSGPLSIHL